MKIALILRVNIRNLCLMSCQIGQLKMELYNISVRLNLLVQRNLIRFNDLKEQLQATIINDYNIRAYCYAFKSSFLKTRRFFYAATYHFCY